MKKLLHEVNGCPVSTGIAELSLLILEKLPFVEDSNSSHNDNKGSSFFVLMLTVYLFNIAIKLLKDSNTQHATAFLDPCKNKPVMPKHLKDKNPGSDGGFGRARIQLLSVRLHVNWIY